MSKGKVELFTPEGSVKDYKLFSARLPEFLRAFPKEEGYRVKVDTTDPMSHKPGLLKLYEIAIAAGKNPVEVGLPVIAQANTVVFTASLLDKEGNVLESASALKVILEYKDWEKGETAARQRLISALGFGGECFDADELSDMDDQGLRTSNDAQQKQSNATSAPSAKQEPEPKSDQSQGTEVKASSPAESNDEQNTSQVVDVSKDDSHVPVAKADDKPAVAADGDPSKEDAPTEVIPPRIIRQIEHQAKLKGVVEIPPYRTVKEAKTVLKDLMTR